MVFCFNSLSFIILVCFLLCLIIQLFYYWGIFGRLAFYKLKPRNESNESNEPVSIVISAHNEFENLERLLPLLFKQKYSEFEVVVVNDCSDDSTEEFLNEMLRVEPRLKVVQLRQSLNFFHGKKFPLSMGIKSAQHDLLLLTDADCYPESEFWIQSVVDKYKTDTEIVVAYGPYEKHKGLLNKLIRFDTLHIAIQYLSFALIKKTYMGVGRNLSYRKSLFIRNKGFISHYNIQSGDDDLFISQVANKKNVEVLISNTDRMISVPKTSFSSWIRQKRRHLSTGLFYKTNIKWMLGLYSVSQLLFYISFVLLLVFKPAFQITYGWYYYPILLILLFLLRTTSQMIIFSGVAKRLSEKGLLLLVPFCDLFFAIFTPLLGLSSKLVKPKRWK